MMKSTRKPPPAVDPVRKSFQITKSWFQFEFVSDDIGASSEGPSFCWCPLECYGVLEYKNKKTQVRVVTELMASYLFSSSTVQVLENPTKTQLWVVFPCADHGSLWVSRSSTPPGRCAASKGTSSAAKNVTNTFKALVEILESQSGKKCTPSVRVSVLEAVASLLNAMGYPVPVLEWTYAPEGRKAVKSTVRRPSSKDTSKGSSSESSDTDDDGDAFGGVPKSPPVNLRGLAQVCSAVGTTSVPILNAAGSLSESSTKKSSTHGDASDGESGGGGEEPVDIGGGGGGTRKGGGDQDDDDREEDNKEGDESGSASSGFSDDEEEEKEQLRQAKAAKDKKKAKALRKAAKVEKAASKKTNRTYTTSLITVPTSLITAPPAPTSDGDSGFDDDAVVVVEPRKRKKAKGGEKRSASQREKEDASKYKKSKHAGQFIVADGDKCATVALLKPQEMAEGMQPVAVLRQNINKLAKVQTKQGQVSFPVPIATMRTMTTLEGQRPVDPYKVDLLHAQILENPHVTVATYQIHAMDHNVIPSAVKFGEAPQGEYDTTLPNSGANIWGVAGGQHNFLAHLRALENTKLSFNRVMLIRDSAAFAYGNITLIHNAIAHITELAGRYSPALLKTVNSLNGYEQAMYTTYLKLQLLDKEEMTKLEESCPPFAALSSVERLLIPTVEQMVRILVDEHNVVMGMYDPVSFEQV
jgi:hypothetical protein